MLKESTAMLIWNRFSGGMVLQFLEMKKYKFR